MGVHVGLIPVWHLSQVNLSLPLMAETPVCSTALHTSLINQTNYQRRVRFRFHFCPLSNICTPAPLPICAHISLFYIYLFGESAIWSPCHQINFFYLERQLRHTPHHNQLGYWEATCVIQLMQKLTWITPSFNPGRKDWTWFVLTHLKHCVNQNGVLERNHTYNFQHI